MSLFKKKEQASADGAPKIKIKKTSKKKKWIIITAVILVVVLLLLFVPRMCQGPNLKISATTAKVSRGNVEVTLTGSGTIEANDMREIRTLANGDITADYFEENDIVQKDAPLYQMDISDMETSIQRAKDNLSKAQRTHRKNMEDMDDLSVKAPISGTIAATHVSAGNKVGTNTNVVTIQDNNTMILTIDFNKADRNALYVGASAQVLMEGSSTTYNGIIDSVSTDTLTNSYGVEVIKVEIAVRGQKAITPGSKATAIVNNSVACNAAGSFSYNTTEVVRTNLDGTIKTMNYKVGDSVSAGAVIATLESDNLEDAIYNSQMAVEDAQLSLNNLMDTLEDSTVKSPIAGTIIQKNAKAGDTWDSGNSATAMAIVADMSVIKFDISVDELDIGKIREGQDVTITADAIEGKIYTGYIDKISAVGTTSNGVTTYPVTVIVNNPEDLRIGMNVEASITVSKAENVLTIPATALSRGNGVWVKEGSESAKKGKKINTKMPETDDDSNDIYKGYVQIQVETGLSNSQFVEIKSGLKEGDEILIVTVTSDFATQMMNSIGSMHGGGGMPGGGMPGGDMPAGGPPSGGGMPSGGAPGGGGRP